MHTSRWYTKIILSAMTVVLYCNIPVITLSNSDILVADKESEIVICSQDTHTYDTETSSGVVYVSIMSINGYNDVECKSNAIPEEDIELIALVTMAEAEGECEEGKRLVIDTILNRVDSKHFPDSIKEVIYQKNQFTSMWNGRIERVTTNDYIHNLVIEELEERTNYDVIFFTAGKYGKYGKPLFSVENHYFCEEDETDYE